MDQKTFIEAVKFEFDRVVGRINYRRRGVSAPLVISCDFTEDAHSLWMHLESCGVKQTAQFAAPYCDEQSNTVIGSDVKRAVGTWFLVEKDIELDYWSLMHLVLTDRIETYFPNIPGVGKRSQFEKMLLSFEFGKAPIIFRNFQRLLGEITNKLPVCGTPMQAWAMNNRVVFIDPVFDTLTPKKLLEYQAAKAKKYFPWALIGLSDSTMVKNYMLKEDLRKYSPFCVKHHSPMRNLYQPLGMSGPEKALVTTRSMRDLEARGIERGGWNWMTCFVDMPLNFEDQIIINEKHRDKVSTSEKVLIAYGTPVVKAGDQVKKGSILSMEPGSKVLLFQTHSDAAWVKSVDDHSVVVNGQKLVAKAITVEIRRVFKDGFKFTNLHGNKGVAVFGPTGVVYDPIRKRAVDIDVIVAAKTVGNRKNFGQIFEALCTLVNGSDKQLVIADDYQCDLEAIKAKMVSLGCNKDGTVETKIGKKVANALCGWVFWGLLREPEDSLWEQPDVLRTNQMGIRVSGNKISHIELKGLTTTFGPGSAVVKEILMHQEGVDVVREMTRVLKSVRGDTSGAFPTIDWKDIKPINQKAGFLHEKEELLGTISDEFFHPNGFFMTLPFSYQTVVPKDSRKDVIETSSIRTIDPAEATSYITDKLYIPFAELREPWQHQCGLWGISDVAGLLNSMLLAFAEIPQQEDRSAAVRMVRQFIHAVSSKLSTKTGLIATHSLAVRYPHSVKAVAAVSDKLPKNTIQIHEDMARDLGVRQNGFVIVERFPCLGFMSLRVQQVHVTDDPLCRYVIRVSGGSLNSLGLDFDGDVLFLMAFRTEEANMELEYEFRFPNAACSKYIEESFNKKGPRTGYASLDDMAKQSLRNGQPPMTFAPLTPEVQVAITEALVGIKAHTGTCVALGYNIARLTEGAVGYDDFEVNAGTEVILDMVANSVFGSKHAVVRVLEQQS